MSLGQDLKAMVDDIIQSLWSERDGRVVPADTDVKLLNDCVRLDATVLYADLDESTNLVDEYEPHFAAEVYKTYLHCASKIVRSEGGAITSFDGDRVMAVFLGDSKNTAAARTALKLNWATVNLINPAIEKQYGPNKYTVHHVVGVDTSVLHAVRSGIRGSNDLVWVGRAANHAAKLCTLPAKYSSRITAEVYDAMNKSTKFSAERSMWEKVTWNTTGREIYRSTWMWKVE